MNETLYKNIEKERRRAKRLSSSLIIPIIITFLLGVFSLMILPVGIAILLLCFYLIKKYVSYRNYYDKATHLKVYLSLNDHDYAYIKDLGNATKKDRAFIIKELSDMIEEGWLEEGHISNNQEILFFTDEAYEVYHSNGDQLIPPYENDDSLSSLADLVNKGEIDIEQVRILNKEIDDPSLSRRITKIEKTSRQILERIADDESHEEITQLVKYYLPKIIKLIESYIDYDRKIQTQDVIANKKGIEEEIFQQYMKLEKLLDHTY